MLISNLRRHPRDAAWLAAWSGVQALPAVASGWAVAEATTGFLAGRTAAGLGWLALLAAAYAAGAFGTRQGYLRLGALVEPLRDDLVGLVVAGALARSTEPAAAPDTEAVARMTHQVEIVRDAYAGVLTVACTFALTAGSTLAGLVTLVPATLPYVLPPVVAAAVILRLLLRPFAARQRRSVLAEEQVASATAAAVSGLRDVTACGAEDLVLRRLSGRIERQAAAVRSAARLGAARVLCMSAAGWAPLLLLLAATPSMLRHGVSAAHVIGAITYIMGSLRASLNVLSQGVSAGMVRLSVTLERILEASAVPSPGSRAVWSPAGPGGVSLREVCFGYGADLVIDGLSLEIAPGEHLAIVGPSGIGKSSLAGLLAGMLTPVSGQILLDGVRPDRCPPGSRVLIPQEAYVFAGTLAENLWYLRSGPPCPAELSAAAGLVGLSPVASRLGGFDAVLSPVDLSAGERQLIALTRALLAAAPVAILDEATCHLDPAAEERAEAAFAGRPGTLIVIAHRISSALRADRVLVLDGIRAQAGDHASLLSSSAMYRDLVGYWTAAAPAPAP